MKAKSTSTTESWCAVYTAWPASSRGGRSRSARRDATARAFTWSDHASFSDGMRLLRVDGTRWQKGGSQ